MTDKHRDFLRSVENEFWAKHPELVIAISELQLNRKLEIHRGGLDEEEYIARWLKTYPNLLKAAEAVNASSAAKKEQEP